MLTLQNIDKFYGKREVFTNLSITIYPSEKLGLVGRNGVGKSTLFKIIAGEEPHQEGDVFRQKGLKIGYISQRGGFDKDVTLWDHMMSAFERLIHLEERLQHLADKMAEPGFSPDSDDGKAVMEDYNRVQSSYEIEGGYGHEAQARMILNGLGFLESQYTQPMRELSGGQQQRALLARLLAMDADLLLLDEPDNHLDLKATLWLEQFLKSYKGAYLLITHDRAMLNNVVEGVFELRNGKIRRFEGGFDSYMEQARQLDEQEWKAYEMQITEIRRQEEFIRRNIAGQKTRQAQSRRKMLAKLERMERPDAPEGAMKISFQKEHRGGKAVVILEGVAKSFGSKTVFKDIDLTLYRGQKIALVGSNGAGKTTLVKIMMSKLKPDRGAASLGYEITIGYYDQHQDTLKDDNTLMDEVWEVKPDFVVNQVRSYLGRFLFPGDKAEQKISSLSGGERSRMMLLKLLLRNPNFLILDEPTNHLDIPSLEVLEQALAEYSGTVLLISHDRTFIDALAERLLVLDEGTLEEVWMTLSEYADTLKHKSTSKSKSKGKSKPKRVARPKKPKLRQVKVIQNDIEKIEKRMDEIGLLLSDPKIYETTHEAKRVQEEYKTLTKKKEQLYTEWEESELAWDEYHRQLEASKNRS